MKSKTATYPLRLPRSLKAAVEKYAHEDGTSMNQFFVMAAAEKLSALQTEAYFTERKGRGNLETFRRILPRQGGEPPHPGDELPE